MLKKALALITVNLIVLLLVFLALELVGRLFWFTKSCLAETCDQRYFSRPPELFRDTMGVSLHRYDEVIGYAPRENIAITLPDWVPGGNGETINTDAMGFRKNGASPSVERPLILAAGDSFTFGAQVEDDETWSACLEQSGKVRVLNAGVNAYGTAQSLLRIEVSLKRFSLDPELIILSTLVGADFQRDRLDFMFGMPRAAVIKNRSGKLEFAPPPARDVASARGGDQETASMLARTSGFLYETSWFSRWVIDRAVPQLTPKSDAQFSRSHPKAAGVDEIIDWTIARFAELNGSKLFLLQYFGPPYVRDPPERPPESDYIIERLKEHGIAYVDTYPSIFEDGKDLDRLYQDHHTAEGNRLVCETILASPILQELAESRGSKSID